MVAFLNCHFFFFSFFFSFLNFIHKVYFIYPLFQIHFSTDSLSSSPSHLLFFSFIIFFNHHLFFLWSYPTTIFFNEKCYIHNIFRNTFAWIISKSYVKSCYISFNLNLPLKLFFYSLILTNNNLLLKIYCKNIVIAFLNCHFLFFYIIFPFLISSIRVFFLFFHHTRIPLISLSTLLFLFLVHSRLSFIL